MSELGAEYTKTFLLYICILQYKQTWYSYKEINTH